MHWPPCLLPAVLPLSRVLRPLGTLLARGSFDGRLAPKPSHSVPRPPAPPPAPQGFLYVLDSEGKTVDGWPVQMGEIQVGLG